VRIIIDLKLCSFYVDSVQYVVLLLFASVCYFVITRFMFLIFILCFVLCIFVFYFMYSLFLYCFVHCFSFCI